jgi:GNAT superfamily N-acetyltransferase
VKLVIAQAAPNDAVALAPLFEQLGYPTQPDVIAQRLAAMSAATALVARDGDSIVAFVTVADREAIVGGRCATIEGLVVDDRYRSRGIGARLLAQAERWSIDRGCTTVVVRSNTKRERAHAFYLREGYRIVKSQYYFEKNV